MAGQQMDLGTTSVGGGRTFVDVAMDELMNRVYGAGKGGPNEGAGMTAGSGKAPSASTTASNGGGFQTMQATPVMNTGLGQGDTSMFSPQGASQSSGGMTPGSSGGMDYSKMIQQGLSGVVGGFQNKMNANAFGNPGSNAYQVSGSDPSVGSFMQSNANAPADNSFAQEFGGSNASADTAMMDQSSSSGAAMGGGGGGGGAGWGQLIGGIIGMLGNSGSKGSSYHYQPVSAGPTPQVQLQNINLSRTF